MSSSSGPVIDGLSSALLTSALDGGHKLIGKGCWNVRFFQMPRIETEGAPEHGDTKIIGEAASDCTMENVKDYTLSARWPHDPMYALIVISNLRDAPGGDNATVRPADIAKLRPVLKRLSAFAKTASQSEQLYTSHVKLEEGRSPGNAQKSQRLGYHPTTAAPPRDPDRRD